VVATQDPTKNKEVGDTIKTSISRLLKIIAKIIEGSTDTLDIKQTQRDNATLYYNIRKT